MESVTQRLNHFIEVAYGGRIGDLADAIGFKRSGFYKYTNGERKPGGDILQRLYEVGGNPTWFLTGEGSMFADNPAGRKLRRKHDPLGLEDPHTPTNASAAPVTGVTHETIPIYLVPVAAGPPVEVDDYVEGMENLHEMLIGSKSRSTFGVRIVGESMTGAGIHPGDLVIADRTKKPKNGSIVVAMLNRSLTVKRWVTIDGTQMLLAQNHQNFPILIKPGDELQIIGVVQYVVHQPE